MKSVIWFMFILLASITSSLWADTIANFNFETDSGQDTIAALKTAGWEFTSNAPTIDTNNGDNYLKTTDNQGGTFTFSEPLLQGSAVLHLQHIGSKTYHGTELAFRDAGGNELFSFEPYRQNKFRVVTGDGSVDSADNYDIITNSKWSMTILWKVDPDGTNGIVSFKAIKEDGTVFETFFNKPFIADGIPASILWKNNRSGRNETMALYDILIRTPAASLSTSIIDLSEGGPGSSFDIALTSPVLPGDPNNVTINLSSSGDYGFSFIPADANSLVFTADNWNIPQSVTIEAIEDTLVEGPLTYLLEFDITSSDESFDASPMLPITVNILDNDNGTISIDLADGMLVSEEGPTSDAYTISLSDAPSADVEITTSSDTAQVITEPSTVIFTPTDWSPKTIIVTAVDDDGSTAEDATHTTIITHAVSTSALAYTVYNEGGPQSVNSVLVNILNNDCDGPYNVFDTTGPEGVPDCLVNMFDLAALASTWLDCTIDNSIGCP